MGEWSGYISSAVGFSSGSGSTAARASKGLIALVLDTKGFETGLRDLQGRFTKAQGAVADVNRVLALRLAEATVEALESSLVRPGASTGRLAAALMDPRNRHADRFGFGVGDIGFLDQSQAKYWRAIEQGTEHFLGKELTGYWLQGGEAGGEPAPFGPPNEAGIFRPTTRKDAYGILRGAGYNSREASRTKGIITVPIEPHEYFTTAWDEFDIRGETTAAIQEVFRELGLPVPKRA